MFTDSDLQQLKAKNISLDKAKWQLEQFIQGITPTHLNRPAAIGDGILRIANQKSYIQKMAQYQGAITKFVPASGAASRMFKNLFETMDQLRADQHFQERFSASAKEFFEKLPAFAFYKQLMDVIPSDQRNNPLAVLEYLLTDKGLNYGELPKGLLLFHTEDGRAHTPFEEHMVEGALYAKDKNGRVNLHFTVSPEHLARFEELFNDCKDFYQRVFEVEFQVDFSVQSEATDTLSVDSSNKPFRNDDGSILFRPGGHGALIENLQMINSDLIFIKNIDNVVPQRHIDETVTYKKVLAGLLITVQEKIFAYQEKVENDALSDAVLEEIVDFFQRYFFVDITLQLKKSPTDYLYQLLFRPIRVAGVVKNVGEPGGGPHWVNSIDGGTSLQIVESSQIDDQNTQQVQIFKEATHFNPVDIVCGIKDYKGKKYSLNDFIDYNACFISHKSKGGKELKALELPGLWNGAMANWNTLFVEVPIATFNPVKTVNDLLREMHQ